MSDQARCPNCGALVVSDARWCGQCYAPLGAAAAPEPAPRSDADDDLGLDAAIDWSEVLPEGTERTPSFPTGGGVDDPPLGAPRGRGPGVGLRQLRPGEPHGGVRVRRLPDAVRALLGRQEAEAAPGSSPNEALLRSLLLTGLGHMSMGRAADGIARLILFLWATGLGADHAAVAQQQRADPGRRRPLRGLGPRDLGRDRPRRPTPGEAATRSSC